MDPVKQNIVNSQFPLWESLSQDWTCWRDTFNGGTYYRTTYLQRYSNRESTEDYAQRLSMTPIQTHAKAALLEIRNAIFQRLRDVRRTGGSAAYGRAVEGLNGGVDRRGSSMNAFIGGRSVLTELLLMGKVGVYVDFPEVPAGARQSDTVGATPYLYPYRLEDIRNFTLSRSEGQSQFETLLLRDTVMTYDADTGLPDTTVLRFRYLWIDARGKVSLQFYSEKGEKTDRDGNPNDKPIELELSRIPFVLLDIGDGLLKDVCTHQIALLNLASSDVSYAWKSNVPIFTRQSDGREGVTHLRGPDGHEGTATEGGQGATAKEMRIGNTTGILYAKETDRPGFINPSSEPLIASKTLQDSLKDDIRTLINLAVASLGARQSAESKSYDNQGLENGLSYIGLVLEGAEKLLSEYWAAYEEREPSKRLVPVIKYPDRYSLKTDADRIDESTKLTGLMAKVPSQIAKREIAKCTVQALLGGKVSVSVIEQINKEIDAAPYTTSDPETIAMAMEQGLCGDETGSLALGFNKEEYVKAREAHALRAARIIAAQKDAGARGAGDLSIEPTAGSLEKMGATDTALNNSTVSQQRGAGANTFE
jgi:hypothetical protein